MAANRQNATTSTSPDMSGDWLTIAIVDCNVWKGTPFTAESNEFCSLHHLILQSLLGVALVRVVGHAKAPLDSASKLCAAKPVAHRDDHFAKENNASVLATCSPQKLNNTTTSSRCLQLLGGSQRVGGEAPQKCSASHKQQPISTFQIGNTK
jgi:hypothetical protein